VGNRLIRPTRLAVVMLGAVEIAASPARAQGWNPAPASGGVVAPASAAPRPPTRVRAVNVGLLEMSVRRLSDSVEVVIGGVGPGPQLLQTTQGSTWQGSLLVATPTTLRRGPQRLSLPEAGLQSISIDGAGSRYSLLVTPVAGYPLGRPVVSADGSNLILSFAAAPQVSQTTYGRDLALPGRVPQPDFVPSLQPRAVAPPVGDMAVGSIMLTNSGFVNVSGPPVSMTLSNAPIQQVLMLLAKLGGYGLVFVNDQAGSSSQPSGGATPQAATATASTAPQDRRISIAFRDESYGRAVNSSLMAAGLQGKLEGNTLLVGPNVLGKGFGAQLSKVYRLNQVGANAAADYIANLGALVTKTNTVTTAVSEGVSSTSTPVGSPTAATTTSSSTTQVETYGAANGPLVGLRATTDTRLSTITLIGDPRLVAVGEQYLKQLDLRQRQVALSVKILDVNLSNNTDLFNSFAIRWGNNFIVNDNGTLAANFGSVLGASSAQGSLGAPLLPGIPLAGYTGRANPGTAGNPSNYPNNNFFDFFQARVLAENSKVLASPTLILQEDPTVLREEAKSGGGGSGGSGSTLFSSSFEDIDSPIGRKRGNEGVVRVGINVPTNVTSTVTGTAGTTSCTISSMSTAGLVLGARVQKIDDNGFVTFSLSPSISAVEKEVSAGVQCPPISILRVRRLDTGVVRVRDGQTLILTGVISDFDRAIVSKWPILGDIPIIGQFFRGSANDREKRELVIMVTPRIIDDTQGGTWGYGYQPSTSDTRRFLGNINGQSPY
jgi:type IV pilus assembly protein PilQ